MPNDITGKRSKRRQKSGSFISSRISLNSEKTKYLWSGAGDQDGVKKRVESKIARLELNLTKEIKFDTNISISNAKS